jgi:erythromycin esterase-like protein
MQVDKRFLGIKDILTSLESYLLNHKDKPQHEWVKRNLEIIKQNVNDLINPLAAREVAMAENIFWIQKQNPEAKIVLWAHNGHVHKHGFHDSWYTYMGEHLAKVLGDKYRTIGFVANQGSYTARDWSDNNKLKRDLELNLPPENSLEFKIKQFTDNQKAKENAGETLLYLDLRDSSKPAWLSEIVTARLGVGSMREPNTEYSFTPYNISEGYDGIIYIAESHATKPIPPKPNLSTKLGIFSPTSGSKNPQDEQNPEISSSQIKPQNS